MSQHRGLFVCRSRLMVDTRFHLSAAPLRLPALLEAVGQAMAVDDERIAVLTIAGASELDTAGPERHRPRGQQGLRRRAAADRRGRGHCRPRRLREYVPATAIPIVAERPHELFADLLGHLYPADTRASVKAMVDGTYIAPRIEEGALVGENVVLGPGVEIGSGTLHRAQQRHRPRRRHRPRQHDRPQLLHRMRLCRQQRRPPCRRPDRYRGLRLARFRPDPTRKIPQLGRVILQDGVEVGANSTIDRGALGDTVIGEGTKIDNLVQIGHNCRIGRYCLIAGMAGLAGSTVLGDGVLVGAGAGTAGHITIGAGSVVYARAGVTKRLAARLEDHRRSGAGRAGLLAGARCVAAAEQRGATVMDDVAEKPAAGRTAQHARHRRHPRRAAAPLSVPDDRPDHRDRRRRHAPSASRTSRSTSRSSRAISRATRCSRASSSSRAWRRPPAPSSSRMTSAAGGKKIVLMLTIDKAKFRKPAHPGDRLEYHIRKIHRRRTVGRYEARAMVDGQLIAEAEIGAMIVGG